ncbi:MAG: NAD(P)-dependent dehydrogenase (short-subunit alcohol dehydrogenase family) [Rickettsiales bacterium]|jgi:NAD(P)-dependent dehydrogenase (short-subunit alcohol dehydrogenase family)
MSLNVVVTGANRGIGLSFCKYFNNLGFNVYGVCRQSSAELEKVAAFVIENIDIGNADDCKSLFDKLSGVKIDLLINNAGILLNETLGQIDFYSIEKQFQINALGALRVTEGLINNLHKTSKIAIITSRMGSIADNGSGRRYGYRMSKAALNAAGKSLAIDLEPRGIAVGIFHPGLVSTDMIGGNGDISPDEAATRIARLIDKLAISNSGTFWHSNGEILPW